MRRTVSPSAIAAAAASASRFPSRRRAGIVVLLPLSSSPSSCYGLPFTGPCSSVGSSSSLLLHTRSTGTRKPTFGCGKYNDIKDAEAEFDLMLHADPVPPPIRSFNGLFSEVCKMGHPDRSLSWIRKLELGAGPRPDLYTHSIVINCFCRLRRSDLGFSVLAKLTKLGLQPDAVIFTTLINGLSQEGKPFDAAGLRQVVTQTLLLTLQSWTASSNIRKPMRLWLYSCRMIVKGISPTVVTYACLMQGLSSFGHWDDALRVVDEMLARNLTPQVRAFNFLLNGLSKSGLAPKAEGLFEIMVQHHIQPDIITYNTLLDGYSLRRETTKVRKFFAMMVAKGCNPDVLTYNIMIHLYCKLKKMDEAMELYEEMSRNGIVPDNVTCASLMTGFFRVKKGAAAMQVYNDVMATGAAPDLVTLGSLLHGMFRLGYPDDALLLFEELKKILEMRDVVLYNTVMDGLFAAKRHAAAREVFHGLIADGVQPVTRTCNIMINALCKDGFLDEAYNMFRNLEDYKCSPDGCTFNVILHGFLRHRPTDAPTVAQLMDAMRSHGFWGDVTTLELVGLLFRDNDKSLSYDDGLLVKKFESLFEEGISLRVFLERNVEQMPWKI
ncbi:hypothetical protein Tsubulata_015001 [Turnera subulata]|uniref:Pentacotripeptide-repeat region of PRORP domain-containing protein n=1 Tax=Turnera subulata TaxID=218843 RepID=A0A9Q0F4B0_9ROSI|nr:hypothetical protein Tsubulata_015001 [Turnera subulata]